MSDVIKHYTASVFIISDGAPAKALLLHHRKFDKWLAPGGHQEGSENPIEAALREVKEETGLDLSDALKLPTPFDAGTSLIPVPNYFLEEKIPAHGDQPQHYHLDQIYVIKIPEQTARHDQAESHDIGWFTLEETEKLPAFENVRMILRQELQA